MLIALFVFEIIIVGLTILTTRMIEHKFKMIKISLAIYCNKRTYKTKANIDFIESILGIYDKLTLDTDEEPDLESAIKRKLQHEYIGKFSYISVKNVAIKAKRLMWAILSLEFIILWVNQEDYSGQMVILITMSFLLTIIMAFYGIIRGVDEKGEALIDEIIHYVKNIYPLEQSYTISVVEPKQSAPISLEEHKVKRESIKANEKIQEVNKQSNEADTETKSEMSKVKQKISESEYQEMCEQDIENQYTKKNTKELSASDIAKLLEYL